MPLTNEPVGMTAVRGAYGQRTNMSAQPVNNDPYASVEYRNAFKEYVQRGTPIPTELIQRAGGDPGPTITSELGAIIPSLSRKYLRYTDSCILKYVNLIFRVV